MARNEVKHLNYEAGDARILNTGSSRQQLASSWLPSTDAALNAVAFTTQNGSPADIAGFVSAHPQIPRPGDEPRYLLFGPAIVHALCGTGNEITRPDPHIRLVHTGTTSDPTGVTLTWSGAYDGCPSYRTGHLRESAAKLNAHARLAVIDPSGEKTMVLVPHPAVLLVLAASDFFDDAGCVDDTCRALAYLILDRPTTEDPRQWRKLLNDTANSFDVSVLRNTALARIHSSIDNICREMGSKRSTDSLRHLLS
jgi:hypothetical protein